MTRNPRSETTRSRRSAIALAAALTTVALTAAGVVGEEPLIQPEPVEPPIVEPAEIAPVAVDGQYSGGNDIDPSQDLIAGLDNTYLRGIAREWQLGGPDAGSALGDELGCVEGPSRAITIC